VHCPSINFPGQQELKSNRARLQSMANDIALPRQTLSRYLDLLELIFVIKRIPAW
jgi:predicted AAA+ superfamily ATPase